MKVAELLRGLADMIDSVDQPTMAPQPQQQAAELTPAPSNAKPGDAITSPTMVPPLQQKLELLKKAVDVDSQFDGQTHAEQGQPDELDRMKQMAGITPVEIISAEETEAE